MCHLRPIRKGAANKVGSWQLANLIYFNLITSFLVWKRQEECCYHDDQTISHIYSGTLLQIPYKRLLEIDCDRFAICFKLTAWNSCIIWCRWRRERARQGAVDDFECNNLILRFSRHPRILMLWPLICGCLVFLIPCYFWLAPQFERNTLIVTHSYHILIYIHVNAVNHRNIVLTSNGAEFLPTAHQRIQVPHLQVLYLIRLF